MTSGPAQLSRRGVLLGAAALPLLAGPAMPRERLSLTAGDMRVIEGGRSHALHDVVFEVASDFPAGVGLEVEPGAEIDVLRIRVLPGVRRVERLLRIGTGARIGLIDVAAAEQVGGKDEEHDGFVQIRGDDVSVGAIRFRRIDRCLMVYRAARLTIGTIECTSYVKTVKFDRCEDVHVDGIYARKASPNARRRIGFSAMNIADSLRLDFPRIEIEDAAVHGVYLAGGSGRRGSRQVRFGHVTTRRSGRCGFKCKAPVTATVDVSIDRLEVIDAAFRNPPGRNEDALRVENTENFRVGRLDVSRDQGTVSCYAGVYLDGVRGFALGSGHVDSPAGPMVMIQDGRGRPNSDIHIVGLHGSRLSSHGYLIDHSRGQVLEGLIVDAGRLDGVAGDVVRVEGNARIAAGNRIDVAATAVGGVGLAAAPGAAAPTVRIEPTSKR